MGHDRLLSQNFLFILRNITRQSGLEVTLYILIREVLLSNLGRGTGFPNIVHGFPQPLYGNSWIGPSIRAQADSFHIPSNSSLILPFDAIWSRHLNFL
jgi:hypothetical protein